MSKRRELARLREEREKRQLMIVLAIIGVMFILILGGAVLIGLSDQRGTGSGQVATLEPISVSTKPSPPNAEVNGRAWGPKDAPIKVEEFIDYQCPACGAYARDLENGVVEAFAATGKVRYEIHNFPFKGKESRRAAEAVYCATEQDKFWRMHATIFINQPSSHGDDDIGAFSDERLKEMAAQLELEMSKFNECFDSRKYEAQVNTDYDRAISLGLQSTPTFVINGKSYPGAKSADDLRSIFAQVAPKVQLK